MRQNWFESWAEHHTVGQCVPVGVTLALREPTKSAAGVADVGAVDVSVHHERHVVADDLLALRIHKRCSNIQSRPLCRRHSQALDVAATDRIALRRPRRCEHVAVDPFRCAGGQLGHRLPVSERAAAVAARDPAGLQAAVPGDATANLVMWDRIRL